MTRIIGNYQSGEVQLRINSMTQSLRNKEDKELESKARQGFQCAGRRDSNRMHLDFWNLVTAPLEFYEGIAAMQLLAERRGEDYALNLMGFRRPQTFYEKICYFFTGSLPEVIAR